MSANPDPDDLHYRDYLRLGDILNAQSPRSTPDNLDELHFIITHQALELWFKLMVHNLVRACDLIEAGSWSSAIIVMRRVTSIATALLDQTRTLRYMPPHTFHAFRRHLGTASGVQSSQFREIEVLCGLRDPAYLAALQKFNGGIVPDIIRALLKRPSLSELLMQSAKTAGIEWTEVYTDPERWNDVFMLAEQLLDYDEAWCRWRCEHVLLVQRVLGSKRIGTAGSTISYLQQTLDTRFFPFLWDARNRLGTAAPT